MAIFNCKMCGGDLDVQEGSSVCECEYCGTKQTVPSADNEKKRNLFNRANRLRSKCEFDKAAGVYESLVAEFPEEAEAYWGLCLCKFGIEYIDDPGTAKKIPTCHRTSYESIFDDTNFDQACENADAIAVSVYRSEAKEIDRLQKEILEVAKNEQPFDVFICYKESDENGERTVDSEIAHEIYDVLVNEGYKVFFSRITLKTVAGDKFEPHIFSALNSAKVMLSVGTKYEYFNAVWVKNEWSRFLALMNNDSSKKLIPCYKDIDPEDMPKEFAGNQGFDMSKPTAYVDLLNRIKTLIPKGAQNVSQDKMLEQLKSEMAKSSGGATVDTLLERVFDDFLEFGNWKEAKDACNDVLNRDPKNARACVGMLMARLKISKEEGLDRYEQDYGNDEYYVKALRYSDEAGTQKLEAHLAATREYITERDNNATYNNAVDAFEKENFSFAKSLFAKIPGYRDADEWLKKSTDAYKAQSIENRYQGAKEAMNAGEYDSAKADFDELGDYKDSRELGDQCSNKMSRANQFYDKCRAIFRSYDENVGGPFAPAIQEFINHKNYMVSVFPWFDANTMKGDAPEPKSPKKKNAIMIPLSLGLIISAFLTFISGEPGIGTGVLFIALIAMTIANYNVRKYTTNLSGKTFVVLSIIVIIVGGSVLEGMLEGGRAAMAVLFLLAGIILLLVDILVNVKYFKAAKKNRYYEECVGTLDQLFRHKAPALNADINALTDEYSDIMPRIKELTDNARKFYVNSNPDAGRIFSATAAPAASGIQSSSPDASVTATAETAASAASSASSVIVAKSCPFCGTACGDPNQAFCVVCGAKFDQ